MIDILCLGNIKYPLRHFFPELLKINMENPFFFKFGHGDNSTLSIDLPVGVETLCVCSDHERNRDAKEMNSMVIIVLELKIILKNNFEILKIANRNFRLAFLLELKPFVCAQITNAITMLEK